MTFSLGTGEAHDRGAGAMLRAAAVSGRALSECHVNNLSGLGFLPLGRESAVSLPRANSRECCARARLSGFVFRNATQNVCRQALTDLPRVRIHNSDPLRKLAGFDASQPSERVIHEVGQVLRVLGQIIRGGND